MLRAHQCLTVAVLFGMSQAAQASLLSNNSIFFDDFSSYSAANNVPNNATNTAVGPWDAYSDGSNAGITFDGNVVVMRQQSSGNARLRSPGIVFPADYAAEVRFNLTGSTPTGADAWELFDTARLGNGGVELGAAQDAGGPGSATYNLTWGAGDGIPVIIPLQNLTKGTFYTVTGHKKSDGSVDVYLDGALISTQSVTAPNTPIDFFMGSTHGAVNGFLTVDYVSVGNFVPEPGSMALSVMAGLGLLAFARRKRR